MIRKKEMTARVVLLALIFTLVLPAGAFAENSFTSQDASVQYLREAGLDEWAAAAIYPFIEKDTILEYASERAENSNTTTDYARYIIGDRTLGLDVTAWSEKLKGAQLENGKFADQVDGTGTDLINAHIWSVLGLYMAYEDDYDKDAALSWLRANQNFDGSFGVFASDVDLYPGSPDMTAMAICAYKALGLDQEAPEISLAFSYLDSRISDLETSKSGASAEAIAWVLMAKRFVGLSISDAELQGFEDYALSDNTYSHFKNGRRTSPMTTYHVLLAAGDEKMQMSWMDRARYKNGVKTESGLFLNSAPVIKAVLSQSIMPNENGALTWDQIRQVLNPGPQ